MIKSALGALVASTLLATAFVPSASAASAVTDAFMANLTPNVDFLDRSSRFALTNSKSVKLKTFAHKEAADQTLTANALYDWSQTGGATAVATADLPLQTGRSVATAGQTPIVDNRLPAGQEDLDLLGGLDGKEFDDTYKAKQVVALQQVEADYKDYIAKGDDPILLAIASRELPKVERALAEIGKL